MTRANKLPLGHDPRPTFPSGFPSISSFHWSAMARPRSDAAFPQPQYLPLEPPKEQVSCVQELGTQRARCCDEQLLCVSIFQTIPSTTTRSTRSCKSLHINHMFRRSPAPRALVVHTAESSNFSFPLIVSPDQQNLSIRLDSSPQISHR